MTSVADATTLEKASPTPPVTIGARMGYFVFTFVPPTSSALAGILTIVVPSPALERFRRSMVIGYEEWHEGTPYDLGALAALEPAERDEIEAELVGRAAADWRDVQALDVLGTARALKAVEGALSSKDVTIRLEAAERLRRRKLLDAPRFDTVLVESLAEATLLNGMTRALGLAQEHASPAVLKQLLLCAERGNDDIRCHAAALIHYLFGIAKSPFDWDKRPFYLRFVSKDRKERRAAYIELCREVGVDPENAGELTLPRPRRQTSRE